MRALLLSVILLTACTSPDRSRAMLEDAGYSNIEIVGYGWWNCPNNDYTHRTRFRATNPVGHSVEGTVCCTMAGCVLNW